MGRERLKAQWARASLIASCALNSNPYLRKPVAPNELNPFREPEPVRRITLTEAMEDF